MKNLLLAITIVFGLQSAHANVRLPAVISSNMVLQQKSSVKLWGWSDAAEKIIITTSWNNKVDSTIGDGNGKWQLAVETPAAGGPYTITVKGYNSITLDNVLVGEVWICSGQSNMEMNYTWGIPQMKQDVANAFNPNIRFFHIPKSTADTPQEKGEGTWMQCDSNSVKWFSAVAYYFGKKLNSDLNVPVGLIHASWGGTPAEVWTPAEEVINNSVLKSAAQKLNSSKWWPVTPGYAYNSMLAPVTNFSIAGAIWYQGETNTGTNASYHQLLSTLIGSWRSHWDKDFPFYFVQLAPFNYGNNSIGALLREAQAKTLSVPKTGIVVTTDLADDTADIHPKNKKDVGYRLANLALAKTYGKENISAVESPLFRTMEVKKNTVVMSFSNAQNGFLQKEKPNGFFIAGADQRFFPAESKIVGNTIVVWSKSVPQPVAVRYAFSNTAIGNVFSKEGLPLTPFRTDEWK